ncbi:uncharacterized protein LOC105699877 isoform X2 [Orussus abietinus]|uniref:uncharacterized protein LOC105699877 isoform X2 n=1 Tax=Orussus abietinus TaxID=222816 RepID=UPI0006257BD1|nr:uncharacterized protein LOC105699877 isoform X2 [Orussus abietinus]
MTVFYHTVIFIILAISRSIAVLDIPYEGFGDPSSSTPTFIYSSQEPTAIFRGYSYTIDDSTGGNSRVFFVVGPDSFDQVKIEVTRTQPTQNVKSVTLNGATEDTKSLKNETSTVLSENSEKPDKVSTMDENSKMVEKSAEPASKEAGRLLARKWR